MRLNDLFAYIASFIVCVAVVSFLGCGKAGPRMSHGGGSTTTEPPLTGHSILQLGRSAKNFVEPGEQQEPVKHVDRKIIYTGNVDLVVPDIAKLEGKVESVVQQLGGFVAAFSRFGQ